MTSSTRGIKKVSRIGENSGVTLNRESDRAFELLREYCDELRRKSLRADDRCDKPERGTQTIERILEAAHCVFVNEGHASLSLRKVAQEAGIAVGNLTYHFPSKQDLIEAMLQRTLASYVDLHLTHHQSADVPEIEVLLNVVEFYVRNARENYKFFYQLWGYAGISEEARATVRNLYRPIGRFVYHLVRAANPALDDMQIRRAVAQISSIEEGFKLFIGLGPDDLEELKWAEADTRALVRRIVETP